MTELKTVYDDSYVIYEDKNYLKSEEDIQETAENIYGDFVAVSDDGYSNVADVVFKIGEEYYLVHMQAEVECSSHDLGDVYHIGDLECCAYEKINVIKREINNYRGKIAFQGTSTQWEKIKEFLEENNANLLEETEAQLEFRKRYNKTRQKLRDIEDKYFKEDYF